MYSKHPSPSFQTSLPSLAHTPFLSLPLPLPLAFPPHLSKLTNPSHLLLPPTHPLSLTSKSSLTTAPRPPTPDTPPSRTPRPERLQTRRPGPLVLKRRDRQTIPLSLARAIVLVDLDADAHVETAVGRGLAVRGGVRRAVGRAAVQFACGEGEAAVSLFVVVVDGIGGVVGGGGGRGGGGRGAG